MEAGLKPPRGSVASTHRLGTRGLGTHGLGTHGLGTHGLGIQGRTSQGRTSDGLANPGPCARTDEGRTLKVRPSFRDERGSGPSALRH
jgi:hypothetical protein